MNHEQRRLAESRQRVKHWKRWGPYLSERQWGTVREDYSPDGSAWDFFPHEHARSRTYRWGEDGIGGISDRHQRICFALALWNGNDPFLKERLFGLTGPQGNHGEDVKEYYFYLDSTPTHSYMKFLYKYPQAAFPYQRLIEENQRRSKHELEFELLDTGVFNEDRYFDIFVEYAKADVEDILVQIEVINRGPEAAHLDLLPTIWFRNTWSFGLEAQRPQLRQGAATNTANVIELDHHVYGRRWLYCDGLPALLFTENETNKQRFGWGQNETPYVKDSINDYIVHGAQEAVNPDRVGTKAAAHYPLLIGPGQRVSRRLRFTNVALDNEAFADFEQTLAERRREADEFYRGIIPEQLSDDAKNVMRQAFGGLLWSKQFYYYDIHRWLNGDPGQPLPPPQRLKGRNHEWTHLYNDDVISMPDKWEYPWYAVWDLAFHCVALALVDPDLAKEQLILMLREWYMHPNGQIPAYEWALGDVNPPVHAWAAWRVYKIEKKRSGHADRRFLERVFHKLLLNFTWWVNRKDAEGKNVFQGGFLGLDNIGVFDRSKPLPTGGHLEQSDATSWMGMYCLNMLAIAMELAKEDPAYEDVASKFFEHFVYICRAMNNIAGEGIRLWDEQDGFFYDVLHLKDGANFPLKVRSMVGLIPLFAVETLDADQLERLPGFLRRMEWFINNRPEFGEYVESEMRDGRCTRRFLSLVNRQRLRSVLRYMLDENEFLSPYGIRALSRFHKDHPYVLNVNGAEYRVDYEPAESSTGLFGGNSNWRGPVWMPVNYLIIESLQKFHYFLGDDYTVEFPTGSGRMLNLWEIAAELSRRVTHIFLRGADGRRPVYGGTEKFQHDPHWRDLILFYEYFHGDNGAGIGASHQTGWTALVAKLLQQSGE
ncbi:MAG: glucosidase [Acidobacteriota bacterium]|nr:glucosidase [Blastocatellia bacterium]MDW8240994.1 glucosidase [Acidobacteriota bacterium]